MWCMPESLAHLLFALPPLPVPVSPPPLCRLQPPLGLGSRADGRDVLRFVFDLDIPLVMGRVPFHKTAFELVRRCSGAQIPEGALKDQVTPALLVVARTCSCCDDWWYVWTRWAVICWAESDLWCMQCQPRSSQQQYWSNLHPT